MNGVELDEAKLFKNRNIVKIFGFSVNKKILIYNI